MVYVINHILSRNERDRKKQAKRDEKLRQRDEVVKARKVERLRGLRCQMSEGDRTP